MVMCLPHRSSYSTVHFDLYCKGFRPLASQQDVFFSGKGQVFRLFIEKEEFNIYNEYRP
jgi:hypothetical protein